jgi:hypothetical protein
MRNRKLQQQLNTEIDRDSKLACKCENNGDLCTGCEARREMKRLSDDRKPPVLTGPHKSFYTI